MDTSRLLTVLTVVNAGLLCYRAVRPRSDAAAVEAPGVLRGRPNVRLGASRMGAGLLIGGESDPTYVQVLAEEGASTVKLVNRRGRERLIEP